MNEIMNEQMLVNISIISMDLLLYSPEPNRLLLHSPDTASVGNSNYFLSALSVYETQGRFFLSYDLDFTTPILDPRANHSSLSARDTVFFWPFGLRFQSTFVGKVM